MLKNRGGGLRRTQMTGLLIQCGLQTLVRISAHLYGGAERRGSQRRDAEFHV